MPCPNLNCPNLRQPALRLLALLSALLLPGALLLAGCTARPAGGFVSEPAPATVVVAFDQHTITPLIVEGLADRASGRMVAANDPVRIASISKLVMALAALALVDEGTVSLDQDVSDYLGWRLRAPGFPDDPVTLGQLLSHRAGLSDRAGYIIALGESLSEKLADPAAWQAGAAPGKAPFLYANLGSPLAASALEAASGERYDRLVERTVFAPLGIAACLNWITCAPEQSARAVALYRHTGEVARDDPADLPPHCTIPVASGVPCDLTDYRPGSNASVFSPQGGVRIGMVDLAKLGQAILRAAPGAPLSAQGWQTLLQEGLEPIAGERFFCAYGYGIQRIEGADTACTDRLFGDGRERLGQPGEAYGLVAGLWVDRAHGQGIAYFTTAVPPHGEEGVEGGFAPREFALMARARALMKAGE